MNARDNLKPKSIRVAILSALSDGAITTIDDLQIKLDEPRKKVVDNAVHAANDGLIKRMRDDVTNQAAYQILPKGRELLAKYASGKVEAPVDVVVMREIPAPEVSRRKSEAVALDTLETAMPGFTAEVVAQKDEEIARLRREMRGLRQRPAGEMREMLRAMQYGEMTVSRGVELLEMWLAGNYSDEYLPAVTPMTNDDEIPVEVLAKKDEELRRMTRLFNATIADLAIISEALGVGSDCDGGAGPILAAIDELERSRDPVGYVIQRPAKPLVRFTKAISAETRAMAFARTGQRAQVFALHLVGTAVPGSEWRKA